MMSGIWQNGLVGTASEIGALAYASPPPIHFADYFKAKLANNLLSSPASAQTTFGTFFLSPVRHIWEDMRNIAYGLFIAVMVVTGFMIMLRREISPRLVVTFTNALPRIIMGLILITFSFPLIGLIVDVGVVFASEVVGGVVATQLSGLSDILARNAEAGGQIGSAAEAVSAVLPVIIGHYINYVRNLISNPPQVFISLLLMGVFALAAVVTFGLTVFRVIIAYAWLLVYTIFSPLLILFGSLPGQEGQITNLGKKIVAKTLTFPAFVFFTGLGLFFGSKAIFGEINFEAEIGNWGNLSTVLGGSKLIFSAGILGSLLSLIMLAAAWKAPSMIEEALGVGAKPKKK